ncbi:hypothetical protein MMC17_002890 [Xylographa soralifera]|nr:hypothetical protein [Xylographa soralifera]
MTLCSNRPEGFGPRSHLYSNILTSCFLDTVLVPLCTWLYLLAVLIFLLLSSRRRNTRSISHNVKERPSTDGPELFTNNGRPLSYNNHKRSKAQTILLILYTLLIIAAILMTVLEIVRLALANLGIGLLPFTFVGIIVAGMLHLTSALSRKESLLGRRRGWTRWVNLSLWTALVIVEAVKITEEVKEGVGTRVGTKYPMADEVTDVGVMIGVYVALGVLEVVC